MGEEFNAMVKKVANSYSSLNVFVRCVKPYNPIGRFQTEQESDELSKDLLRFLEKYGVELEMSPGSVAGYDELVEKVLKLLKILSKGVGRY